MNRDLIRDRYLREPFPQRLGHLASDLARVSSFLDNEGNMKAVSDILEESKFFIEWTAADAPAHIQEFFSEIQPKLALWHLYLLNERYDAVIIGEIRDSTKNWSDRLVEFYTSAVS